MIEVVSPDLKRLAAGARVFPKVMRAGTRKSLAAVARDGQNAVKEAIRGMPVKGDVPYKQGGGLRRRIANATRVSATVNTGSGAAVRVYVAQTGALAAHNRGRVAELLDQGGFRHPLWGNRKTWKSQAGYPYFDKTLSARLPALRDGMSAVLTEAIKATIPNVR